MNNECGTKVENTLNKRFEAAEAHDKGNKALPLLENFLRAPVITSPTTNIK